MHLAFSKKQIIIKQRMIGIVDENVLASMLRHSRLCLHRIVYSSEKTRGEDVSTVWHFCRGDAAANCK